MILQAVAALVAGGAVATCAAEIAARRMLRRQARYCVWQPGRKLELHLDRDSHPRLESVVRFEVNDAGERGPAIGDDRSLFRVLATGGSTVESFLLNHDASWPGALQRYLSTPSALASLGAERVHVGNIGKSGVGAAALSLILRRVLPRYPVLDLLLVMVGASDVLLWLESDATKIAAAPSNDYFAIHPDGPFGFSPRRTALWELLRRARDRRVASRPERRDGVAKWIGKARAMRANAAEVKDDVADPAAMLASFEENFRAALRVAGAHARRVIVVKQPWFEKTSFSAEERALFWNGGVGKAVYQHVSVFYSDAVLFRLMHSIDEAALRVCEELGVEQIDVMPVLERSVNTYYDHFHHTPTGADAIARIVAERVLRSPHRPPTDAGYEAPRRRIPAVVAE